MKDLNFFSVYEDEGQSKRASKKLVLRVLTGFAILVALTVVISFGRIQVMEFSIRSYENKLNDSEVQAQIAEVEEMNDKISIFTKYQNILTDIVESVSKNEVVTASLLAEICSQVPSDVNFKIFSIDGYSVSISGVSYSRTAIGEFEHNLDELESIENVQVNSIMNDSTDGSSYSFEITCELEGN